MVPGGERSRPGLTRRELPREAGPAGPCGGRLRGMCRPRGRRGWQASARCLQGGLHLTDSHSSPDTYPELKSLSRREKPQRKDWNGTWGHMAQGEEQSEQLTGRNRTTGWKGRGRKSERRTAKAMPCRSPGRAWHCPHPTCYGRGQVFQTLRGPRGRLTEAFTNLGQGRTPGW